MKVGVVVGVGVVGVGSRGSGVAVMPWGGGVRNKRDMGVRRMGREQRGQGVGRAEREKGRRRAGRVEKESGEQGGEAYQEEVADAYSAQNDSHQILRSHGRLFPHTSCQQRHECVEKSPEQPDLNEANAVHEVAPVNLHQHDQKTEEDSVRAQNGVVQGKICGECVHIGGQGGHPHQAGGEMEQLEREQ